MALDPRKILGETSSSAPLVAPAPLAGTRAQRVQRLQIGLFGLGMMVLLVGLAQIILTSAQETKATVAVEAVPVAPAPKDTAAASDPLADAGVLPDIVEEDPPESDTAPQPPVDPQNDLPNVDAPAAQ